MEVFEISSGDIRSTVRNLFVPYERKTEEVGSNRRATRCSYLPLAEWNFTRENLENGEQINPFKTDFYVL